MAARILLIEDNPANLELMSYLLRAFGYEPLTALDGAEGLDAVRRETPDLIVCDVQLPKLDGCEVARRLKADRELRSIPLVAVTAMAMVGDRERVLAAGFDGYIAKPIDPETFVRQLEVILRADHSVAAPLPGAAGGSAPERPVSSHTILVVDNLPVNLELARSILEPNGFKVLTAPGMIQGLALARQHPCDLILSDVCMYPGSGYEFIQAVKADPQLRMIPFVFITSTMMDQKDRARGLALGATKFLWRPMHPNTLLAEIRDCLREEDGI